MQPGVIPTAARDAPACFAGLRTAQSLRSSHSTPVFRGDTACDWSEPPSDTRVAARGCRRIKKCGRVQVGATAFGGGYELSFVRRTGSARRSGNRSKWRSVPKVRSQSGPQSPEVQRGEAAGPSFHQSKILSGCFAVTVQVAAPGAGTRKARWVTWVERHLTPFATGVPLATTIRDNSATHSFARVYRYEPYLASLKELPSNRPLPL